ncbi:MAG: hypothetical protein IKT79_05495 [Akkermansia sp.]|nr:hypothetical protein [Akkermansia sp.]
MNSVPFALCAAGSIVCAVMGHLSCNTTLAMAGTVAYSVFALLLLINHPTQGLKVRASVKQTFVRGGIVSGAFCVSILIVVAAIVGLIVVPATLIMALVKNR